MRNNNYHSQTRWNLKRELKNVTEQKDYYRNALINEINGQRDSFIKTICLGIGIGFVIGFFIACITISKI